MVRLRFTGSSTWWRRILIVWPVASTAGVTTLAVCNAPSCFNTIPLQPSITEPQHLNDLKAAESDNSTARFVSQNGPFMLNESFKRVGVYATAFFPSTHGKTLWNNRLNFSNWKGLLRHKSSPETHLIASYVKRNVLERKTDVLLESTSLQGWRHPTIDYEHLIAKWTSHLMHLQANSSVKSSFGNRLTMLVGDEILPHLLECVKNATRRIWIETYIFDGSPVGEKFILALAEAAKRKVDVLLLVDWLGGFDMPTEWISLLRKAGVTVSIFNNWRHPAFRDHRKLAVIDEAGFCGSANIGENGANRAFGGNGRFFDIHVKVEGPAVEHLGQLVLESWKETGPRCDPPGNAGEKRLPPQPNPIPREANGDVFVQILESNAKRRHRAIQSAYNRVIASASVSISTTAGYFVPPFLLRRSLKAAINQGVPVNLILSGNSDVWGDVYAATFSAAKLKVRCYHTHFEDLSIKFFLET